MHTNITYQISHTICCIELRVLTYLNRGREGGGSTGRDNWDGEPWQIESGVELSLSFVLIGGGGMRQKREHFCFPFCCVIYHNKGISSHLIIKNYKVVFAFSIT